ncbi:MAG: hypothetical protein L6R37_003092 [Teloschistes peruensis]|nr:MAG: hypothetical protein L6R37_003092 [Teloschistes peruensis]
MHPLIVGVAGAMFTTILGWLYGVPIYHTITDGNPTWPIWENPFKAKAMIECADYVISFQADRFFPSIIPGATSIGRPYIMDHATLANLTAVAVPPAPTYLNATYLRGNVYVTNLMTDGTLHTANPISVNLLLLVVCFLAFVDTYLFFRNRRSSTELKSMSTELKSTSTELKSSSSFGKLIGKLFFATTETDEAVVALLRRLKQEVQQLAPSQALDAAAFSSHVDYILAVVERANTSANDYDQTILKLHTLTGERDNLLQQLGAADEGKRLALASCLVLNTRFDMLKDQHAKTKDQYAKTKNQRAKAAADCDAAWRIVKTQMQDADMVQGELEGLQEENRQLQEDKIKLGERLEEQTSKPQPPSTRADDMTISPGQKDAGQDVGSSEDRLAAPSGSDVEPKGGSNDGPASSSEDRLAAPSGSPDVEPIGGSNDSLASLFEGSLDAPSDSDVEPIGGSDDSPSCPSSATPTSLSSSHDEPEPGASSGSDESLSSSKASAAAPSGQDVDPGSGSDELPPSIDAPPATPPTPANPPPSATTGSGSGFDSDSDHKSESSKDQPPPSDPPLSPTSSGVSPPASESSTAGTASRLPLPLTFGATNPVTAQPWSPHGGRGGGRGSPRIPGVFKRREPNHFIMPNRRVSTQQGGSSPLRPQNGDREGGVPSTRPNFENNPMMQGVERLHNRWKQDMRVVGATEADWPKYMEFRTKKDEEAEAAQREGRFPVRKLEKYPDQWQM